MCLDVLCNLIFFSFLSYWPTQKACLSDICVMSYWSFRILCTFVTQACHPIIKPEQKKHTVSEIILKCCDVMVHRLCMSTGRVWSCPGWIWTGSWTCRLGSQFWICLITVWRLFPRWCRGVLLTCARSTSLTICSESYPPRHHLKRSSAAGP